MPYATAVVLFVMWASYIHYDVSVNLVGRYLLLLELPQGSYWYLILMFYWYVLFFVLTYVYDNKRLLLPLLFVASFLIVLGKDFSRSYVWQFFSFPLGAICGKYGFPLLAKKANRIMSVILLLVFVISVVLKKTPYVETRELGVADTFLQITLTLAFGGWLLINRKLFTQMPVVNQILLMVGSVSYELYLSHVIALDNLKEMPSLGILCRYICITVISMTIIVIVNRYALKPIAKKS